MNDYLENQWILIYLEEAVKNYGLDEGNYFFKILVRTLREHLIVPFVACFSSDGDVLSQWRAYADDGTGFAIGFSTEFFELTEDRPNLLGDLDTPCIYWSQVVYDELKQKEMVFSVLKKYQDVMKSQDENMQHNEAPKCAYELLTIAPIIKNPKFSEEQEWRIVHPVRIGVDYSTNRYFVFSSISKISFRQTKKSIYPYFSLNLGGDDKSRPAISEIYFGPRNSVDYYTVAGFLQEHGFPSTNLLRSAASYR